MQYIKILMITMIYNCCILSLFYPEDILPIQRDTGIWLFLHMDCPWFPHGNDRMLDEGERYRLHLIHTLGINRDHCTLGHSMLQLEGIHHQSDIQLWEWMEGESGGVKELNIDFPYTP